MIKDSIGEALKIAMKGGQKEETIVLRMMMAALKDREIELRTDPKHQGALSDAQTVSVLENMIKQCQQSILLYEQGGRGELVAKEQAEIKIIQGFLPTQLGEAAVLAVIQEAIAKSGAQSMRDMGKVIQLLKESYAGQMDFAKASELVKKALQ